jgi:Protein of unknown function (DUF1501)
MLRVLGSSKTLCNGVTRRDMLQAGGLGLFGFGLSDLLRLKETQAASFDDPPQSFGKAKSCILLYLYGSPSQLETVDMKPDAPDEIKGEMKPIASSLPGLQVCEYLPNMATVMDRCTVVRSITHPHPIHGVAHALTGVPTIDVAMELSPNDPRHWPFFGSVIDYVEQKARGGRTGADMPNNIALPWHFSSQRVGEVPRAGFYSAFLGGAYNPVWTEFDGSATRSMSKTLGETKNKEFFDPYLGVTPESRFVLPGASDMPADLTLDRLNRRRSLVDQFDEVRRDLDRSRAGQSIERYRDLAYSMVASQKVRAALDIQQESLAVRESYGMTIFGQAALAARRLVEAGTKLVTVIWDEFGLAGSAWDTHWDHYPKMKNELLPGLDKAFAGLILDLERRGMLDETLVLCMSEHGRTPKMNKSVGGGRDHWSQCYSQWFAGGGLARGNVVGKSDKWAAVPSERPVSPKDILATIYHLMGIDHHQTIVDRVGRPLPLVDGQVVNEMLA